jgi:hypothetical protein
VLWLVGVGVGVGVGVFGWVGFDVWGRNDTSSVESFFFSRAQLQCSRKRHRARLGKNVAWASRTKRASPPRKIDKSH